jgi:predicted dehydrogenase
MADLISTIDHKQQADYPDLEQFIREDQGLSDVVCVTTPNALHAPQSVQLLNAGYHVVIEKPMALSRQEAEQIREAAVRNSRKVFIVMQNRYSPSAIWLKELISKGMLGELFFAQVNGFWNRDERYYSGNTWHGNKEMDGGTLFTQFSHFVDLLFWCFGDIRNIQSRFFDFNHAELTTIEDSGFVQFEFEMGGLGQFNYSTSAFNRNLESSLTILAEKGSIKIGGQYMDEIIHCEIDSYLYEEVQAYSETFGKYSGNAANHRFVFQNVIKTLLGDENEHTNLQEGIAVVDIIERIYRAGR